MLGRFSLVLIITWVWVGAVGAAAPSKARVPEDARKKARAAGVVSVLVSLNGPAEPLGQLTPQQRAAQQDRIKAAEDQLLGELPGTRYRVTHRYEHIAAFAIEVGPDALTVLEKSNLVQSVFEDNSSAS
jgi:hypothetical protein